MRTNLTSRTIAQNTETQTVDAAGTRVYSYNNYNEVESETLTGGEITHAVSELRDGFGRGTGYTYAEAGSTLQTTGVSYAEATGRIATASFVYAGSTKTFAYNYLSGTNLLESLACPSNLTLVHTYEDKRDLVTGMRIYRGAGTDVVLRNYTYDALGRPLTRATSRNGTTQNDTFGYNPRSELTSATLGNANYAYAFDNIGNRETSSEAGTALAYTANNLNQYTEICSAEPIQQTATPSAQLSALQLSYDADGNATLIQTSTGTWSITYNGANRPVRFRNEETDTTVECGYDSQGRRYFKKVTVAGTVTLHHRYIYRGYLQIACVDCTRSGHPALWFVTWDPSQATATRPLAIQKDGTWFTYGYDLTKNICEVFGPAGYIRTAYSYAPFGAVSESGDVSQPFQWSSEHYDSELNLVYYNFRHYSPSLGRFLSRDPIEEQGGLNLYAFAGGILGSEHLGLRVLGDLTPRPVSSLVGEDKDAGGITRMVKPFFRINYATAKSKTYSKNGKCCFKYERYPEIDIVIYSVYRSKIQGYTQRGINAIKGHEARRISTYVYAHDFYLQWIVNFLSGKEICCSADTFATDALGLFANKVMKKTQDAFETYVKVENDGIEMENIEENRIRNGKGEVDGLKKIYQVKKPRTLPVIDFEPSCGETK